MKEDICKHCGKQIGLYFSKPSQYAKNDNGWRHFDKYGRFYAACNLDPVIVAEPVLEGLLWVKDDEELLNEEVKNV